MASTLAGTATGSAALTAVAARHTPNRIKISRMMNMLSYPP